MMLYERLNQRERENNKFRVALVGAGAMGVGIAYQVARTPGMELACVVDLDPEAAQNAARAAGVPNARMVGASDWVRPDEGLLLSSDPNFFFEQADRLNLDVLVEATNSIGPAAQFCTHAIEHNLHVVLMNAEVDLAVGPLLNHMADDHGVVVTSDAGDQHGVLARMIDEIRLWDFRIVMAGNIKGFLNRYATAESLLYEAKIRNLNPIQCAAYTDGTKLNIEMAVIANGEGLVPYVRGMEGPRAKTVDQVFDLFDFDRYEGTGVVDYILGAEPGGGVFVVGHCDDPLQRQYLKYYKMGEGPYYLFYRPYHLCHLETTRAIAMAALDNTPLLRPTYGRLTDVYAFAKRDVEPGEKVEHGIGGDVFYGLIEEKEAAEREDRVPIALLETVGGQEAVVTRSIKRDEPLTADAIDLPDTFLVRSFEQQKVLLG